MWAFNTTSFCKKKKIITVQHFFFSTENTPMIAGLGKVSSEVQEGENRSMQVNSDGV